MWINEVKVGGKLARKSELKTSANGKQFIYFTVHSSKEKKQQYTPCVAFGDLALVVEELQPDCYLTLEGEISTSSVDNKQTGKKDYKTSVIAHKLTVG
jgi:single-stranded DNA-binding protein